jgi:hypothetical protein
MLQYIVTIAESNTVSVLHAVRWLSSAWEQMSRETNVKSFQRAGFNNYQGKN